MGNQPYSNIQERSGWVGVVDVLSPGKFRKRISALASATGEDWRRVLDCVAPANFDPPAVGMQFHYIQFDASGKPALDQLVDLLETYHVCFAMGRSIAELDDLTYEETVALQRDTRAFFRNYATGGEAGELLLYFLVESVLGAPQLMSKMKLKTNPGDEVKGSDGLHVRLGKDGQPELIFGEAKLYKSVTSAVKNAIRSISDFHDKQGFRHELVLLREHHRAMDNGLRDIIRPYIENRNARQTFRKSQAILIGFQWEEYVSLLADGGANLEAKFRLAYEKHAQEIIDLVRPSSKNFPAGVFEFHFFFLPFTDIQGFRDRLIRSSGASLSSGSNPPPEDGS